MTALVAKEWAGFLNSPGVSVADKLDFIERISTEAQEQSGYVFDQIGEKNAPTFGFAARTMRAGNRDAARLTLMGKGADVVVPSGYAGKIKTYIGNALAGRKGETAFNAINQGVIDYSKGTALEGEPVSADDKDVGEYFGSSIGYIKDYNGQKTILPQGVSEDDFDTWLDDIQIEGNETLQGWLRAMPDTFKAPIWAGGPKELQLIYVDDGKYRIRDKNNGKPLTLEGEDGKPYILEYPKVK